VTGDASNDLRAGMLGNTPRHPLSSASDGVAPNRQHMAASAVATGQTTMNTLQPCRPCVGGWVRRHHLRTTTGWRGVLPACRRANRYWRLQSHAGFSARVLEMLHYCVWLVALPLIGARGPLWDAKTIPLFRHRAAFPG